MGSIFHTCPNKEHLPLTKYQAQWSHFSHTKKKKPLIIMIIIETGKSGNCNFENKKGRLTPLSVEKERRHKVKSINGGKSFILNK